MSSQDTIRNILLEIRLLLRSLFLLLMSLPALYWLGVPKVKADWFGIVVMLMFIIWPLWLFVMWLINRWVNGLSGFERYLVRGFVELFAPSDNLEPEPSLDR